MAGRRVKLTMQRIAAAECPPAKAHALLWDSEWLGLCVRVYPTGRKGRLRWLTIGEVGALGLAEAREAAGIHLGSIAKGHDPAAQKGEMRRRARALLEPAIERYRQDLERRQLVRGPETISMLRRELLEPLGNVDLATLSRAMLVERVEEIERAGLRGKAKDFRAKAGTFLNWATSSGLITANPFTGWRRSRRTRAERLERAGRTLADSELPVLWQAVWAAQDAVFGAYIRFLLLTGQRRSETAVMRWADVDLAAAVWTIPAEVTKSGRTHRVPLPQQAVAVLEQLPRMAHRELVFPGRGGRPMSGWTKRVQALRAATSAAGMGYWRLHDLRRTVRTGLGRLGVDPQIAELLLNHAIGDELAATYDRGDYWQQRADAAGRWAHHVLALVEDGPERIIAMPRRASG